MTAALVVTFVGSGDAFGSGGRLQTCILIDAPDGRLAVDFGTTSLVGLHRLGIDPNTIDAIVLTHLHGDHCGGLPFLMLDAMLGAKRTAPLTIAGPHATQAHLRRMQAALFPGSETMEPSFDLRFLDIDTDQAADLCGARVTAVEARHTRQTHPLALRLDFDGTVVAYTGDGEWTPALAALVDDVDLLIAESYFFDKPVKWHLNYPDIARLSAKRIVLTHMHSNMLAHAERVPEACAYDGYTVTL